MGSFPGYRWGEWNGRYRDVIRRFVKGEKGIIREVATRICGSSDLYESQGRLPISSINFVTCHDGFTLYDLFSYNQKHNEANGENNKDGCNNNLSYNCGIEGESEDEQIIAFRKKCVKNVFAILLLSQGVPMLNAGDEFLNSQSGNNNVYCQDNDLSWLDWRMVEKNSDIFDFVKSMISLRKRHNSLMRRRFLTGKLNDERGIPDITWYGIDGKHAPFWFDAEARVLIFTLAGVEADESDLHIIMNMDDHEISVELPLMKNKQWCLVIDTSLGSSMNNVNSSAQQLMVDKSYSVTAKSIVVFENTNA